MTIASKRIAGSCVLLLGLVMQAGAPAATGDEPPPTPAAANWTGNVPVGLYLMTRYHSGAGLETSAWYWAPNGTVYEGLATGFSEKDLAAHKGRKGQARLDGQDLVVAWPKDPACQSPVEKDETGFMWDMGSFTPVSPVKDMASIAGSYEGGKSIARQGSLAAGASTLELNADGTYVLECVARVSSAGGGTEADIGSGKSSRGTWSVSGWTLTLTATAGEAARHIVFPYDDPKAEVHPAHLYVGGTMFRHR